LENKRKINQSVFIAIGFYIFFAAVFIYLGTLQKASAMYPKLLMGVAFIVNTFYLLDGIKRTKSQDESGQTVMHFEESKYSLLAILFFVAYIFLFQFLGYFLGSAIFFVALLYYLKVRSIKWFVFITGGYLVAAYLIFVMWLHIPIA